MLWHKTHVIRFAFFSGLNLNFGPKIIRYFNVCAFPWLTEKPSKLYVSYFGQYL